MKTDVDFNITEVRKGWRYKAARFAILTEILGGLKWHSNIISAMTRLRMLWHMRLKEYRSEGWKTIQKNYIFIRNCPPFGVITTQAARPCNMSMICPFCYAREYVIRAYNHIESFIYGGTKYLDKNGKLLKAPEDVKLVEFQSRHKIIKKVWNTDILIEQLNIVRGRIRELRRREINMFPGCCGIVLWRIEPMSDSVILTRSGLIITRDSVSDNFVPESAPNLKFWFNNHPKDGILTKEIIGRAVARVFSYPLQLFVAPPKDVIATLAALKGVRLFSAYGVFQRTKSPFLGDEIDD